MYPFSNSVTNQNGPPRGGNNLASQQMPNPNQMVPQMLASNNQFQPQSMPSLNNQFANLNNLMANNTSGMMNQSALMPPNCYQNSMNMQLILQSGLFGMQQPFLQGAVGNQHAINLNTLAAIASMQGQLYNTSQNLNNVSGQQMQAQFNRNGFLPQNFPQNANQAMGFSQGQFPPQNPMLCSNSLMSQQSMPNQPNQPNQPNHCMQNPDGATNAVGFSKGFMPQTTVVGPFFNSSDLSVGTSQLINSDHCRPTNRSMNCEAKPESNDVAASTQNVGLTNSHMSQFPQHQGNMPSVGFNHCQNSFAQNSGIEVSNAYLDNTNHNCQRRGSFKRGQSQGRLQTPQTHHTYDQKRNFRPSSGNRGRGRGRHSQFARFSPHSCESSQRCLSVNYSEQEIQQWREARKRNFPTKAKVERLAGNDETADRDALIRRQQLKDVLNKQAELGVEIAELPPNYFVDLGNKDGDVDNRTSPNIKESFRKRGDKRRGDNGNGFNKRNKPWEAHKPVQFQMHKEPSLLQKLLTNDIKQDKSKLRQVFRFMTLNSFFEEWPEKELEFPEVLVQNVNPKEALVEDGIAADLNDINNFGKENSTMGETNYHDKEEEEVVHEEQSKSEEGEISG